MQRFVFSALITFSLSLLALLPMLVTAQEGSTGASAFATNTPLAPLVAATPTFTPQPEDIVIIEMAATAESTEVVSEAEDVRNPHVLQMPEACAYVPNQSTSQACMDFMNEHPRPNLDGIIEDNATLSQYSFWRVGPHAVTTYDAPAGNPIGQIPQGFNFVNAVNENEAWIQSETGQWISKTDGYYVEPSRFHGVLLPENWLLPVGWVLDTTGIYASKYPGGEPDSATGLVPLHYQRFNIYAEEVDSAGWKWYLVGADQWVKQVYMSVIQPTDRPEGVRGRWVAIDLFEQTLVAYENDRPIFATLISTGLPGTETNLGLFEIWARLDRDAMSGATGAPNAYALASVPWVQYFDNSISLHGTYWHDFFGYRRSRGCVNLSISDARWVYEFFSQASPNQAGETVMYVYVLSSDEYR